MRLRPSAGWSQGFTDAATKQAGLPAEQRLRPDFLVPPQVPKWGSVVDDLWALEQEGVAHLAAEHGREL